MQTALDRAKGATTDWQNSFNREEYAHIATKEELKTAKEELKVTELELIHELELRHDGEVDLVNCMQTIRRLHDQSELRKRELDALITATEPVADLFEPRVPREEPRLLVQRLQDTPG